MSTALSSDFSVFQYQSRPEWLIRPDVPQAKATEPPVLLAPKQIFNPPPLAKAQAQLAFLEESVQAPSFAEIYAGRILTSGEEGESVKTVQKLLTQVGFGVASTGIYGKTTADQVKAFQKAWEIQTNGVVGPTTLKALEKAQTEGSPLAKRIAKEAEKIASARGTVGQCYNAVAEAIENQVPAFLSGMHAWMAAEQLAAHPRFREVSVPHDLSKLKPGTIVVWAKGNSPSGHISVCLGKGLEASDHLAPQMQSHYGGGKARAFEPQ
ncbi:hypothetical protein COW36_05615 [bacterium (Candidatus Blackallbacteria) CG17_big_fil_post_rev_8_21_14_2_50_48_46]|uniref:Peptidoglycan binding-like domain-containing protein n=1 Tax=bacterium (Candidatus Blackallbacteria) CG17_big_fil_post_rev_8_21_14_2_50_48_46 TaxID=2014261 RepID=A0A2M7G829_9BACT|nr:MAG: hypothetical protein COW64_21210 [bacterium (Candidatus Blackallbacteria) CG18_big_fil_WC_8_21_14_2_50_49_26]PIW18245.1 MAG: hypothetical protein COW36_05615 [bacterium (Candidatus Blackallbacteria) CG17_big_fil_post_rev_8_21_14_2_50_48_46]PIW50676.1 MAG: hypothetical protein COW20_01880 [bacterium (Candidatus Blackallbacteria) CG13_big_fil_rev_8_21_14_2_50_49_14]